MKSAKTIRIIAMVAMAITTLFFIVFAQIQRNYAEAAMIKAREQEELAKENAERAEWQEQNAIILAADARRAEHERQQMQEKLRKCQNQ